MKHREVMRHALEALESHPYDDRHWVEGCQPAITALRAALAEQCRCGDRPAAECPGEWEPGCDLGANEAHAKVYEPQEPVAWANMKDGEPVLLSISQHPEDRANWMNPVPLYLHPAPQRQPQEPVAKVELMTTGGNAGLATRIVEIDDHLRERLRPGQMLYTAPATQPQPETHPVTGEQLPTSTAGWLHYVTDRTSAAWQEGYERGLKREGRNFCSRCGKRLGDGVHTCTPPAPQRQPLGEDDLMAAWRTCCMRDGTAQELVLAFARVVEAAHGIGKQQ